MRVPIVAALGAAVLLAVPAPVGARGRGGSRSSSSSYTSVHVNYTETGTYVSPHLRSAPGTRSHFSTSGSSYRSHTPRGSSHSYTTRSTSSSRSHVKRDPSQRRAFMRTHPCPSTGKTSGACPGYVVDHVRALKHGGADSPENMQWQTLEQAKAKDRWE